MLLSLPLSRVFFVSLGLIIGLASIGCTVYEIIGDEKSLLATCDPSEDMGNLAMNDIVDLSDLSFTLDEDMETVYVSGDVKVLLDIPHNAPIKMEVEVFRLERGTWMPTIITIKRNNLCESLKDPREFWHVYLMQISKGQIKCPPDQGDIYTLNNLTNHLIIKNLPRWDIEGDLKAIVHFSIDKHKSCTAVYSKVYVK
ncbi:uncharacterized protein Dwil_GK14631 [Drosophila willistoni]|uniref:MD-2-related lipid-recognition domain-containing protein n=2 Tax=Drosophila willistoni TaxID=7260 RepID=B4NPS1_DROWI|nr:uncharacterized protein Dwil_GK14631 [Drosophila willistoni]